MFLYMLACLSVFMYTLIHYRNSTALIMVDIEIIKQIMEGTSQYR